MNSNNLKKQFERLSNCLGNKISGKINFGFTIVELIVVVGIFSLIMAVALWNQKELSNNILITNLSYEIALAVRETQSYGIGVRTNVANPTSADFRKPFGFHVDLDSPKRWVLFQDKDEDSEFDVGEIYAIYTFQNQNGNEITALCLKNFLSNLFPSLSLRYSVSINAGLTIFGLFLSCLRYYLFVLNFYRCKLKAFGRYARFYCDFIHFKN